jgi:type IV secretion system protein VirD4
MVSRSEIARPLLTPGEVMQLPANEEIIMVAGAPPLRTTKARYFEDKRFIERILPPPKARTEPSQALENGWQSCIAKPDSVINFVSPKQSEAQANSGIRREPEPQPHEAVDPSPVPPQPLNEFIDDEDLTKPHSKRDRFRQISQSVARQATLDTGSDLNR